MPRKAAQDQLPFFATKNYGRRSSTYRLRRECFNDRGEILTKYIKSGKLPQSAHIKGRRGFGHINLQVQLSWNRKERQYEVRLSDHVKLTQIQFQTTTRRSVATTYFHRQLRWALSLANEKGKTND